MTPQQREFLKTQTDTKGWYLYVAAHRPMIDELQDAGYLMPTGSFKLEQHDNGVTVGIVGQKFPVVGTLISYYILTSAGKSALDEPSSEG